MNTLLSRFLHYLTFHTVPMRPTLPAPAARDSASSPGPCARNDADGAEPGHPGRAWLPHRLPAGQPAGCPAIGLIAHMDTADVTRPMVVPR